MPHAVFETRCTCCNKKHPFRNSYVDGYEGGICSDCVDKVKKKVKAAASGCCELGAYEHAVPMAIKGRRQDIDFCVADIVAALNAANCGHGKINGSVVLDDGRELLIRKFKEHPAER